MRIACRYCDHEGKAERGLLPRPSRKKTKICPACRANAYQGYWWDDIEEEEEVSDDAPSIGGGDP